MRDRMAHVWRGLGSVTRVVLILWIGLYVAALLVHGWTRWISLDPAAFTSGQLWRLVTYALTGSDLVSVLLGAVFLAWLGTFLEQHWPAGFFLAYCGFCALGAAVGLLILLGGGVAGLLTNGGVLLGLVFGWRVCAGSNRFAIWGGPEVSATTAAWIGAAGILLPALAMGGWRMAVGLACGGGTGWLVLRVRDALGGRRAAREAARPRMGRLEF